MKRILCNFQVLLLCLSLALIGSTDILVSAAVTAVLPASTDLWHGETAQGFSGGNGTEESPYLISSGAELSYLASLANSETKLEGKYFALVSDIDLGNQPWTPIGISVNDGSEFRGNFDGGSHGIYGLSVESAFNGMTGLFGRISGGNVRNLHVSGRIVFESDSSALAGGIAGSIASDSVISGCSTDVVINIRSENDFALAGGLVGSVTASSISESFTSGSMLVDSGVSFITAGGLVGSLADGKIQNCFSTGDVTGLAGDRKNGQLGGIVGTMWSGIIQGAYSAGRLMLPRSGNAQVAGIAGDYKTGSISDTYFNGTANTGLLGVSGLIDSYSISLGLNESNMRGVSASEHMPGLDFELVWISGGTAYPRLRSSIAPDAPNAISRSAELAVSLNPNGGTEAITVSSIATLPYRIVASGSNTQQRNVIEIDLDSDRLLDLYTRLPQGTLVFSAMNSRDPLLPSDVRSIALSLPSGTGDRTISITNMGGFSAAFSDDARGDGKGKVRVTLDGYFPTVLSFEQYGSVISGYDYSKPIVLCQYLLEVENRDSLVLIKDPGSKQKVLPRSGYSTTHGGVVGTAYSGGSYGIGILPVVSFNDTRELWMESAVNYCAARGIVSGIGGMLYEPHAPVTRAEFITMLMRCFAAEDKGSVSSTLFTDGADIPSWAGSAVAVAAELGIARGDEHGRLSPSNGITRQEMLVLLARSMRAMGAMPEFARQFTGPISDAGELADWAESDVRIMLALGLVRGDEHGSLNPRSVSSRAEAAQLIYNFLQWED